MADDGTPVPGTPAPPTGTPSGGTQPPPGVAAGQAAPGAMSTQGGGDTPGVLPPQGAAVPMPVKAAGDHAVGIDILRGVANAIQKAAIPKLQFGSKEAEAAMKALEILGSAIHLGDQGKEDAVDPMQRVQQAIAANRMKGRMQQMGGGTQVPPVGAPMPNRGPVPVGAGV